MRVLIVSDTHGKHTNLDRVLQQVGDIDMFIHLGDLEGGEDYVEAIIDCEKYIIAGNNDFFSSLPREKEFYIGKKKIFIAHGHNYCVSMGMEYIKREGEARNADIVMFGHTHRPYLNISEDMTILNPGSLSYPRQENKKASFLILEVDEEEKFKFRECFLE
ncbi:MAG: metallophosphoesterase [Candidatus Ruminococcus intestinipullorum]|nr:metallophosphoesterase [Candidatus Ruminococcus intestinipullorum]